MTEALAAGWALSVLACVRYMRACVSDAAEERRRIIEEAARERAALLDRIQAPEKAQIVEVPTGKQYVAPDDDEGYWAARELMEAEA